MNTLNTPTFGNLITALYEEIAKLTTDKKLQTKLVYLTLIDMQNPGNTKERVRNH